MTKEEQCELIEQDLKECKISLKDALLQAYNTGVVTQGAYVIKLLHNIKLLGDIVLLLISSIPEDSADEQQYQALTRARNTIKNLDDIISPEDIK